MKVTLTQERLAAAFAEWDRRYREDPDRFEAEWWSTRTTDEYGDAAAGYLLQIIAEQT